MKKMFASIASVLMCAAMFATAAFADSAPATVDYSDIAIGCVQTTDENGNKQEEYFTLADAEYFNAAGQPVSPDEALIVEELPCTRTSDTHNANVDLKSGYMMRYGDYYCVQSNSVTLSCTLGAKAKVAFGYSYTSNPSQGAETYTANSDKTNHSATFSVPSTQYYKFYVTNISAGTVRLKTFTISY